MLQQKQSQAQQWTHEESTQKVGIWPDKVNGGYVPRFFVDDYQPKIKSIHKEVTVNLKLLRKLKYFVMKYVVF